MLNFLQSKSLDLDELSSLVSKEKKSRQLRHLLLTLHKLRRFSRTFRNVDANGVFSDILALSKTDDLTIETELTSHNRLPRMGEKITRDKEIWLIVSYVVFKVNPILSHDFAKSVMNESLTQSTSFAFALIHSNAVESLAKFNPDSINNALVDVAITSTDDSRSIYALKIAKYLHDWSEISTVALEALTRGNPVKRVEAMRLANARSSTQELMAFADNHDIEIPEFLRNAPTVKKLTRLILNSAGQLGADGILYAVKGNGYSLSTVERDKLSARLKNLLGGDG